MADDSIPSTSAAQRTAPERAIPTSTDPGPADAGVTASAPAAAMDNAPDGLANVSGFPSRAEWDTATDADGNYYNLDGNVIDGPKVASGEVDPMEPLVTNPDRVAALPENQQARDTSTLRAERGGRLDSDDPRGDRIEPAERANTPGRIAEKDAAIQR